MTIQLTPRTIHHVNGRVVGTIAPDGRPVPTHPRREPSGLAPADVAAEEAVLGAILIEAGISRGVGQLLRHEHFTRPQHAALYRVMSSLAAAGQPVDFVTVQAEAERLGVLGDIGGIVSLVELVERTPIATHSRHYAEIVRRRAADRAMIDAAGEIARMAYDGEEGALTRARDILAGLDYDIRQAETGDVYDALCDLTAPRPDGWPTGLGIVDYWLGEVGLVPERSLTITGKPGVGKTMLAGLMAANALRAGARVMFATLEMSRREMMVRIGVALLGRRGFRLMRGVEQWTTTDWDTYRDVIATVEGLPGKLAIIQDQTRVDDIATYARTFGADVLFVDFYQLCEFDIGRGETSDTADKANARTLARDLPRAGQLCTVILSQLTRDGRMKYGAWVEALSHAWLHIDPVDGTPNRVRVEPRKNRWGGSSHSGAEAMFDTDLSSGQFQQVYQNA